MNRVKDYYETAAKFMLISPSGQFWIGSHFNVSTISQLCLPDEELAVKIFLRVMNTGRYLEFKQLVLNYKQVDVNGTH